MLEVLLTGGMSTVQDMGRNHYRRFGVGISGPMDRIAPRVGNAMLQNGEDCAFIEIALFPFAVRFLKDCRFSVVGTDAKVSLDGRALLPWWSSMAMAGQVLKLSGAPSGGVAYLCLGGGIDVPQVMGSRSTDLKGGFGGYQGRMLRKTDVLECCADVQLPSSGKGRSFGVIPPHWADMAVPEPQGTARTIRVIPAGEWDAFTPSAQETFLNTEWTVSRTSNRIGARLDGPVLDLNKPLEMLSYGVIPGLIQVPPSGTPIVMQCDAQTAGGYPKIATVIEADQWRVAQTAPGSAIRFQLCKAEEARAVTDQQDKYIENIRQVTKWLV